MIQLTDAKFLTPTKRSRRLSIMLAIHNEPRLSQHKIGQIAQLSSSMVNNYIKEFLNEGIITVSGNTNRTQSYHLTSVGQKELMTLLLAQYTEIIQFYGVTKREVAKRLTHLHVEGIREVALFGAAETAEVVHTAINDTPLKVTAIVDSDPDKQGKALNGFTVLAPQELKKIDADAIVITSFAKQEEIFAEIRELVGEKVRVKKLSDL
ncbi:winged helix-turn-helix transcriptional regulator [Thermodesulfobacteriota bacterium]